MPQKTQIWGRSSYKLHKCLLLKAQLKKMRKIIWKWFKVKLGVFKYIKSYYQKYYTEEGTDLFYRSVTKKKKQNKTEETSYS